jgi:hypothetical protein
MALHVTALFNDRLTAHAAIEQLVQAGFSRDVISVVMSERTHEREFVLRSGVRAAHGWPALTTSQVGACGGVLASIAAGLVGVGDGLLGSGPLSMLAAAEMLEACELVRAGALLVAVTTVNAHALLAREVLKLAGGEALAA